MDIPAKLTGLSKEYYDPSSSYNCLKLHEKLIKDKYIKFTRNVILKNKHLFENKVVLDVDCGTGILSLFVGSQGAKKVFAIESSHLAEYARQNIAKSGLSDIIVVIKQNINEIQSLPCNIKKVDIILSQWMGFLLYDKELLKNLIEARNKWLKSDGIMFPDIINLHITAIEYKQKKKDIYNNLKIHELDLTALKNVEFKLPRIEIVPSRKVVTNSAILKMIDLKTFCMDDFSFSTDFTLTTARDDFINAFVLFFEIGYTKCHKHLYMSTSPYELPSMWKQIILYFENHLYVSQNKKIYGNFTRKVEQNISKFYVSVKFSDTSCKTKFLNEYTL